MTFAFSTNQRIHRSKDFTQAFRTKGFVNHWFIIYVVNNNHDNARLGMVITKKTIPKSVARNYAKRLIREIFRSNAQYLPALDYVIRIRRNVNKESSIVAQTALRQLLLSAKIS